MTRAIFGMVVLLSAGLVGCAAGGSAGGGGTVTPAGNIPVVSGSNGGAAGGGAGGGAAQPVISDNGPAGPVEPVAGHPRLWLRADDLPRLRARAVADNPFYRDGLAVVAELARADMDAGRVPREDTGGQTYVDYFTEMYAETFAFLSLIENDPAVRDDYARRARILLMYVIDEAAKGPAEGRPFREPEFALSDRSRWRGEAFALTVDWIYPYLTAADKAAIRQVFLRWCDENVHAATTSFNHPEPIGVVNDPVLVSDPHAERFALNNYYCAHMRNIGLMAMALDAGDDPDNALHDYLGNATGAWLYVIDHILRNDARGGEAPEGFEYSPQSLAYVIQFLLALHTAGQDDAARWGPQVVLAGNPFWGDMVTAYFHALSPATAPHPYLGEVYQPAWYGDGQNYYAGDFIDAFGTLGLYDESVGNSSRLDMVRWIEKNAAPGGAAELLDRAGDPESFRDSILYFMLFDPRAADAPDPRPSQPLQYLAAGIGHIYSRTSWNTDATWFTYNCGFVSVDHQHGDGNQFEFYRRGEWLTKERTGYGDAIGSSDYHNTLALENDPPDHRGDYREILSQRGSQWLYGGASGDGRIVAHSFGDDYVYATGDATALYNSEYELSNDIAYASRSIVWLKPDHIVIYDRAASRTGGRFKRFWLNLPTEARVSGNRATMTTGADQQLFVTTLLPTNAAISSEPAEGLDGEPANLEPMQFRLRVEAPGGPTDVRFLHVLQGADAGVTADDATLIQSTGGQSFAGARVDNVVVLFPVDLDTAFAGLTYTVPAGPTRHLVTGLTPGGGYDVSARPAGADIEVTIGSGGQYDADDGGVLVFELGGSR